MDVNDNFTQSVHQKQMDRIAELEAENQLAKDDFDRMQRECKHEKIRADKAEAHAADCKRLVTACEDDIDMLRLRCREREAERDRARYGLDRQTKRADEAEAALAAANKVIDAMETFIDSCTYHMRDGNTVSYTGPRAEEGSGDEQTR